MPNVMFLGNTRAVDSDGLTERCLRLLAESDLHVSAVVSDPALHILVEDLLSNNLYGCEWLSSEARDEGALIKCISENKIDIILSVHYPWVLSPAVLNMVPYAFNIHNAKLPEYKGFNMLSHIILHGDKVATTTIHRMAPDVDMGDIAYENAVEVTREDTAKSLLDKLIIAATRNFKKLIFALETGVEIPRIPVIGEGHFYKKDEIIPLKEIKNPQDFEEVDLKARAFWCPPHEPAYYLLNGVKIYVTRTW